MIRATLDTNAIVSGLAGAGVLTSTPGAILRYWFEGAFELVVSEVILEEVEDALGKPYFRAHRSLVEIEAGFVSVAQLATLVFPTVRVSGIATHPEDDLILASAVSADVDCLVTGDKMLLQVGEYQGVQLISPRVFLDILEANARDQPEKT